MKPHSLAICLTCLLPACGILQDANVKTCTEALLTRLRHPVSFEIASIEQFSEPISKEEYQQFQNIPDEYIDTLYSPEKELGLLDIFIHYRSTGETELAHCQLITAKGEHDPLRHGDPKINGETELQFLQRGLRTLN